MTTLALGWDCAPSGAPAIRSGGGRCQVGPAPVSHLPGGAVTAGKRKQRDPSAPHVGDVLVLAESDYRFGVGPLWIRVDRVDGSISTADGLWWRIAGMCRHVPTDSGGHCAVDVRAGAIPAARAAGERKPA